MINSYFSYRLPCKALMLFLILPSIIVYGQNSKVPNSHVPATKNLSLIEPGDARASGLKFDDSRYIRSKISSRKREYRIGELMGLDFAILNNFSEPLFFLMPSPQTISLSGYDANGNLVEVPYFSASQVGLSTLMYELTNPGNLLAGRVYLAVGCNNANKAIEKKARILEEASLDQVDQRGRRFFEEDLFVFEGDGCINVSRPGDYKIEAEMESSKKIMLSPSRAKTLVEVIKPKPFEFKVTP